MRPARPATLCLALATLVAAGALACKSGEAPPGDTTAFDPIAALPEVQNFVGQGWQLTKIDGEGVRVDGTINLEAENHRPRVDYQFQREVEAPADAPPPGAPGASADGRWHERVSVRVDPPGTSWHELRIGDGANVERTVITKGMLKEEVSVEPGPPDAELPAPKCSLAELWSKSGAELPAKAVGGFEYDEDGYRLEDRVNSERYEFDFDCAPRG